MATDYISREAAWSGIYNCPTRRDDDGYIWVRTSDVEHMVDDVPAADVVEVVLCRDCVNYNREHSCCDSLFGLSEPDLGDYCSYGERRTEDG